MAAFRWAEAPIASSEVPDPGWPGFIPIDGIRGFLYGPCRYKEKGRNVGRIYHKQHEDTQDDSQWVCDSIRVIENDSDAEITSGVRMTASRCLFATAVFLGAFLLFLVEPIAAKQLVPVLGGSAAVWVTCLVFFQTALLLAYLYAHWMARRPQWTF